MSSLNNSYNMTAFELLHEHAQNNNNYTTIKKNSFKSKKAKNNQKSTILPPDFTVEDQTKLHDRVNSVSSSASSSCGEEELIQMKNEATQHVELTHKNSITPSSGYSSARMSLDQDPQEQFDTIVGVISPDRSDPAKSPKSSDKRCSFADEHGQDLVQFHEWERQTRFTVSIVKTPTPELAKICNK